ncbi:InlB B-repeat-containing protein, partial [Allochromatium palmeri]
MSTNRRTLGHALFLTLALLMLPVWAWGAVIYVDAGASSGGDGSSWGSAYNSLVTALTSASSGDQVWVKAGVYRPGSAATDSFSIPAGVAVYGGFAGTESSLDERDWKTKVTILSGDIDENDTNGDGNFIAESTSNIVGTNAYHVVWLDGSGTPTIGSSTRLDGFTITAGDANLDVNTNGGGLYCKICSPTLANLTFIGNRAIHGGALFVDGSSGGYPGNVQPTLAQVAFLNNSAAGRGGAVDIMGTEGSESATAPKFTNALFRGNTAIRGGAICTTFAQPVLTNTTLYGNTVSGDGADGAAIDYSGSSLSLINTIVWGNAGGTKAVLSITSSSNPLITYSLIQEGCQSCGVGNLELDPLFTDAINGDLTLKYNSPAVDAGASNAIGLIGVTTDLAGNPRFHDVPAITDSGYGNGTDPIIVDMGAYENQSDQENQVPTVTGLNITGTAEAGFTITGRYTFDDPELDQENIDSDGSSYRWVRSIDNDIDTIGDNIERANGSTQGTDVNYLVGLADRGAYLFYCVTPVARTGATPGDEDCSSGSLVANAQAIWRVKQDATGEESGADWNNAYTNLQDALANALADAVSGDQIWIAAGVYYPDVGLSQVDNDSASTFKIPSGVAVYGGFAGDETALDQRDWAAHVTVLSGDLGQDDTNKTTDGVVTDTGDIVGINACHVVTFDGQATPVIGVPADSADLSGVVVTGGDANASGGCDLPHGGGLLCDADATGGECSPVISNTIFRGNRAEGDGGALYLNAGAGQASPNLINVAFLANSAANGGGIGSSADTVGDASVPALFNVSFSGNEASSNGGAMHNVGGVNPSLTNSILWGNTDGGNGPQIYNTGGATPNIQYSLIQDSGGSTAWDSDLGTDDGHNQDANPQFIDAANGNLRLSLGSPAIDAGTNDAVIGTFDLGHLDRIFNTTVDLGPYEYQGLALLPAASIPADGEALAPPHAGDSLTLQFNLPMQAATSADDWIGRSDGPQIRLVNDDSGDIILIASHDTSQVTYTGNQVVITPKPGLLGEHYHLEVDSGALRSTDGQDWAGISDATTYNFATTGATPASFNYGGTRLSVALDGTSTNGSLAALCSNDDGQALSNAIVDGDACVGIATLAPATRADWRIAQIPLSLDSERQFQLTAQRPLPSGMNPLFALYDNSGNLIAANDDLNSTEDKSELRLHLSAGDYTLWVADSAESSFTGTLELDLNEVGGAQTIWIGGSKGHQVDGEYSDGEGYGGAVLLVTPKTNGKGYLILAQDNSYRYSNENTVPPPTPQQVKDCALNPNCRDYTPVSGESAPYVTGQYSRDLTGGVQNGIPFSMSLGDQYNPYVYTAFFVFEDAAGNLGPVVIEDGLTIGSADVDDSAPSLSYWADNAENGCVLHGTLNEIGSIAWLMVDQGAAEPSVSDIRNCSAFYGDPQVVTKGCGKRYVTSGQDIDATVTTLPPGDYDAYLVGYDLSGNSSGVQTDSCTATGTADTTSKPVLTASEVETTDEAYRSYVYGTMTLESTLPGTAWIALVPGGASAPTAEQLRTAVLQETPWGPTMEETQGQWVSTSPANISFLDGLEYDTDYRVYFTAQTPSGVFADVGYKDFRTPAGNTAPLAENLTITGTPEAGATLTGSYSYRDADGDLEGYSTYNWYRNDTDSYDPDTVAWRAGGNTGGAPGDNTYPVTGDDRGLYLFYCVTPSATAGKRDGDETCSSAVQVPNVSVRYFVDVDATNGANDGTSWENAFTGLHAALDLARDGDEIWVAEGIYYPADASNPYMSFEVRYEGVAIYGGFAGVETELDQRDWAAHVTVLSGDIDRNDTTDANGVILDTNGIQGENSNRVLSFAPNAMIMTAATRLDGFVITGGDVGGGVGVNGAWEKVVAPTIANTRFSGNRASGAGGALYLDPNSGETSPILINVAFSGNSAVNGGAIGSGDSSYVPSAPVLTNVSFSGNQASGNGGALYNASGMSPTLTNVILWGNTAEGSGAQIFNDDSAAPDISNTLIEGGCAAITGASCGAGNLETDPLFIDTAGGDLRIEEGSPAIDAGNNTPITDPDPDIALDLGHLSRIYNDLVDLGAYEYQPQVLTHSVTATAGAYGTISPDSRTVTDGDTTTFTVTPDSGYTASVSGCGGSLNGNIYNTGVITADCTVSANFSLAPVTHSVTATAGAHGGISPASSTVADGATTTFTVTPDSGYTATVSGCGGSLSGNTYTTGPITAACTVSASFSLAPVTHSVTATAGAHGGISPDSRTVADGETTTFTVTPDSGYTASVGGTCGGNLGGNTYTTGAITADCTVSASFAAVTHSVTATAGAHGGISPASRTVADGATTTFTVTPDSGYTANATGCDGTLSGTTYTTGPITADCTVTATFSQDSYTVTATAGEHGSIDPASRMVADGATTTFTVTPDSGYTA